jgi:hypothetical protein
MNKPSWTLPSAAVLALSLAACGQPPATPTAAAQTESQAAPAPQVAAPQVAAPQVAAQLPRSQSPDGATVAILSPRSGDIVSSPVKVVFDVQGMALRPAGDPTPNSGHHHLLVDVPAPDLGQPVPKDAQHLHFGQAQTEVEVMLSPGPHTLQLLLGDSNHVPHDPPVLSNPISITVQ